MPTVNQLILLSNLTNDYCKQFESMNYFNTLRTMINLSNVTSLDFPEETHQYPMELVRLFFEKFL